MTTHSIDVTYAYAQLGLDYSAGLKEIRAVLAYARAYKYSTNSRLKVIERFVEFFIAREQFGDTHTSFDSIRRAYHKKVMLIHPDRNRGNKEAEEQLKVLNAAFALIDALHREAKDYYRQNEETRRDIESEARKARDNEMPPEAKVKHTKRAKEEQEKRSSSNWFRKAYRDEGDKDTAAPHAASRGAVKYMAASIPRFIRTARLSHVPVGCIIGSWHIAQKNDVNYVYDIIMLPEREFMRARLHLSTPDTATPTLQRARFSPPYIPQDVKIVTVPEGESNPERFARNYFVKQFKVEGKVS